MLFMLVRSNSLLKLVNRSHYSSVRMPKGKKHSSSKHETKNLNTDGEESSTMSSAVNEANDKLYIKLHVKPGAKQSCITDVTSETIGVQIAAPPVDGEANTELIRYMAQVLGLKKSNITLEKGSKSRDKMISITGSSLEVENILHILKSSSNKSW